MNKIPEGPWKLVTTIDFEDDGKPSWARVWVRWYLRLDGHEDCCHHIWPEMGPVVEEGKGWPDDADYE